MIDIDQCLRRLDIQLHQIDQGGAAADEANLGALLCGCRLRRRRDRLRAIAGPSECESFHPAFCGLVPWRTL